MNDSPQRTLDAFELHLPSTFDAVEAVVEKMQAMLEPHFSDEEFVYRVVLLASEAVTNAVEHGNAMDAAKQVHVRCVVAADGVGVTVEDEGEGFDPDGVANPLAEDNLLDSGGRGLFLMQHMADSVSYHDEGRRIEMRFVVKT